MQKLSPLSSPHLHSLLNTESSGARPAVQSIFKLTSSGNAHLKKNTWSSTKLEDRTSYTAMYALYIYIHTYIYIYYIIYILYYIYIILYIYYIYIYGFMMICRDLWGFMMICRDLWGFVMMCRDLWGCVVVYGDLWGCVVVYGDFEAFWGRFTHGRCVFLRFYVTQSGWNNDNYMWLYQWRYY